MNGPQNADLPELRTLLGRLESIVLELEAGVSAPDPAEADEYIRLADRTAGLTANIAGREAGELASAAASVIGNACRGVPLTRETADLVLAALETLHEALSTAGTGAASGDGGSSDTAEADADSRGAETAELAARLRLAAEAASSGGPADRPVEPGNPAAERDLAPAGGSGTGDTEQEPFVSTEGIEPEYLREFLISSREVLERSEAAAVAYGAAGSRTELETLIRGVHTLKGDSGYLGLSGFTAFCHDLESFLAQVRNRGADDLQSTVDLALRALDALKTAIGALESGAAEDRYIPAVPRVRDEIRAALEAQPKKGTPETGRLPRSVPGESAGAGPDRSEAAGTDGSAFPDGLTDELREVFSEQAAGYGRTIAETGPVVPETEPERQTVLRALTGLGNAATFVGLTGLSRLTEAASSALEASDDSAYEAAFEPTLRQLEALGITFEEREERSLNAEPEPQGTREPEQAAVYRTMRVDEEKLEQLTRLVSEFHLAGNSYRFLLERLERSAAAPGLIGAFKDHADTVSRLSAELRMRVMSLRTVTVRSVVRRFDRVVRDVARRENKRIRLTVTGGTLEIDKTVADALSEPLLHAVRNACSHGIEPPDERSAAGKPAIGTVSITAAQEGRDLVVTVADDGRGLDRGRILARAEELGIPVEEPDSDAVYDLVFLSGFSTRDTVSEVSGRGVGMDIVRSAIRSLGGRVVLASEPGRGLRLVMSVPVSLGIRTVLLVENRGRYYAFPAESVQEALRIPETGLHRVDGVRGVTWRDSFIQVCDFDELLGGADRGRRTLPDERPAVVIASGGEIFAVLVDRLLYAAELSVKPVPDNLRGLPLLDGVSVLGSGSIVLLISPEELLRTLEAVSESRISDRKPYDLL